MKVLILIVWIVGVILALLGEKRLREYKDYKNPEIFFTVGIILCVFGSWFMVLGALINKTFELPKIQRHN